MRKLLGNGNSYNWYKPMNKLTLYSISWGCTQRSLSSMWRPQADHDGTSWDGGEGVRPCLWIVWWDVAPPCLCRVPVPRHQQQGLQGRLLWAEARGCPVLDTPIPGSSSGPTTRHSWGPQTR